MDKAQALKVSILDVSGLSACALNHHIEMVCGRYWEQGADQRTGQDWDPAKDLLKQVRFREDFRSDPDLTLEAIICRHPWEAPRLGGEVLKKFALLHGLTRVDWLALPYDEVTVMAQLRTMNRDAVAQLPIAVFGFLKKPSDRWISAVCGLPLRHVPDEATIARFLAGDKDKVRVEDRRSASFKRLVALLSELGFDSRLFQSGRETIVLKLIAEYDLSPVVARRCVDVAVSEGWLHKTQIV